MDWIPIKNRLPEIGAKVLVTDIKGRVFTLRIREKNTEMYERCILAWMYLPEPYKKEVERVDELSREELLDKICPTVSTFNCGNWVSLSSCSKCNDKLNHLLDRYDTKVRAEAYEKGRQDAIEDFKNLLVELCECSDFSDCLGGDCLICSSYNVDYSSILDVANELKEIKGGAG